MKRILSNIIKEERKRKRKKKVPQDFCWSRYFCLHNFYNVKQTGEYSTIEEFSLKSKYIYSWKIIIFFLHKRLMCEAN